MVEQATPRKASPPAVVREIYLLRQKAVALDERAESFVVSCQPNVNSATLLRVQPHRIASLLNVRSQPFASEQSPLHHDAKIEMRGVTSVCEVLVGGNQQLAEAYVVLPRFHIDGGKIRVWASVSGRTR